VSLQSRDIQQLFGKLSKFVIDAGVCFGPPLPPGDTVLQNGDSTAEGVLYPAGYRILHSRMRCVSCRIQNAFFCGVAILQHGLPWRRRPEILSRVNYKQTLRVFLTIVVHRVIVGSLVTSLQTCEIVTFFFNCPVYRVQTREYYIIVFLDPNNHQERASV
jgi:hypothetical protein